MEILDGRLIGVNEKGEVFLMRMAVTESPVLIVGETGTEKELMAPARAVGGRDHAGWRQRHCPDGCAGRGDDGPAADDETGAD